MELNGAHEEFNWNYGERYGWRIHKTLGLSCIAEAIGTLVAHYDQNSKSYNESNYEITDGMCYYKEKCAHHYGAFLDFWPEIKARLLKIQERIDNRANFKP